MEPCCQECEAELDGCDAERDKTADVLDDSDRRTDTDADCVFRAVSVDELVASMEEVQDIPREVVADDCREDDSELRL